MENKISIEDFKKIEIKVGKIIFAEKVPETDKLMKLIVDFAEENPRQIISGISEYFPETKNLEGRKCLFVTNLEPRKIKGHESNGMILAIAIDRKFSLLEPNIEIPIGAKVS